MKKTFINLKKVYKYGKKYKKYLITMFITWIIGILLNVLCPLWEAKFVVIFTSSMIKQAVLMSMLLFLLNIFRRFNDALMRKCNQHFTDGVSRNIKMDLGRKILNLTQFELDSNSSGTFISRLTSDSKVLSGVFSSSMGRLSGFISVIGIFVAILIIDYRVFIFYVLSSIILCCLHYIKENLLAKHTEKSLTQYDKVHSFAGELVRGSRDIKMLYAKDSFLSEFDKNIQNQSQINIEKRNKEVTWNLIIDIISDFFSLLAIVLILLLVKNKTLSIAMAFTLYNYRSFVLFDFMGVVSSMISEFKNFNIMSDRVFEVLDGEKFSKEHFGNTHIDNVEGNIEFKDVVFSYNDENRILNKLNLKIDANKTYGIVGKSGEGKTTIFNLICKLYNHQSGKIFIDGNDINDLDEESIRGNITIINQNPYIFNLSIKENLKLVKKDATDKEIKEVCRLACLDEFIEKLPDKYDTVVGEGGVTLSGGQRQRLAIARALIQKTKIILFDEATSALDNETQDKIQQAINNLKDDYTVVIIAHRLSTIRNCDTIFYMEDGAISSNGTHEELIKKCSGYKRLYKYELKGNE